MTYQKQVEKEHYSFRRYMKKERWIAVWYQLDAIQKLNPREVLEIGPGPGFLKNAAATFGIRIETLDLDPELKPDYLASVTDMPFSDGSFEVVCAFQMLEHLPYEISLRAFAEMARVSREHVIISLPDARIRWRYEIYLPKLGPRTFFVPRPQLTAPVHEFDGEHYWEISKKGYPLSRIQNDYSQSMRLRDTWFVNEYPYYRFFVFSKS